MLWIKFSERTPIEHKPILMVAVNEGPRKNYMTDIYCGWLCLDGEFARWPHPFKPTHWQYTPSTKDIEEGY